MFSKFLKIPLKIKTQKSTRLSKFSYTNLGLLILGLILVGTSFFIPYYQQRVLSFDQNPIAQIAPAQTVTKTFPKELEIKNRGIKVSVAEGSIKNGVWELNQTNAFHLDNSGFPGAGGNMVIYAHNTKNLFANLKNVKVDDEVAIKNDLGFTTVYKVTSVQTVKPTEVSVLNPTTDETITVYTCTGFLDSQRFVVKGIRVI